MATPVRVEFENAVYHVTTRGNETIEAVDSLCTGIRGTRIRGQLSTRDTFAVSA